MKTKNSIKASLITLIAIFSISFSYANNSESIKPEKLTSYLEKHVDINYDETKQNLVGLVIIDFTFTKYGKLEVNQINYSDDKLKDIVLEELEQLSKKNVSKLVGQSFIYKFSFVNESI